MPERGASDVLPAPQEVALEGAQRSGEDLKRDAGLRGDQFSNAVVGLIVVFGLGLAVLAAVVLSGRRRSA